MSNGITEDQLEDTTMSFPAYISKEEAKIIAETNYDLQISHITVLNGYDNRNFKLVTKDGAQYIYKVACLLCSVGRTWEAQVQLMQALGREMPGITQEVIPNKFGKKITTILLPNDKHPQEGSYHKSVLLTYLPGPLLGDFAFHFTDEVIYDTGVFMAKLDTFLMNYRDEVYEERLNFKWDTKTVMSLKHIFPELISNNSEYFKLLTNFFDIFPRESSFLLPECRTSIIHSDPNTFNLLISEDKSNVVGIIDFEDVVNSYLVFELGNLIMYNTTDSHVDDMIRITSLTVKGYESILPLIPAEKDFLYYAVAARFAMSLINGLQGSVLQAGNDYLQITQKKMAGLYLKAFFP